MAEGCTALSLPVIGGNVSLYNESGGADIDPTPVLGLLGLVEVLHTAPPGLTWNEGDALVLLGARATADGAFPLDGTRWATECREHRSGTLAPVDLGAHGTVCAFVAELVSAIAAGGREPALVSAVHDVSSGGLAVALAEMAAASGLGCGVSIEDGAELFCELASRFVVATAQPDQLVAGADARGIPATVIGRAGGDRFRAGQVIDLPLDALREAHEGNLARQLGAD
jgi:phosphoribosylformylglycinamidine synthase